MQHTLFDIPPKNDPRLLYGREKELHDLVSFLKQGRWVILLGPRRVGKTSLAKCAAKEFGGESITLDARENSDFAGSLFSSLQGSASSSLKIEASVPNLPFISMGANYSKQIMKNTLDALLRNKSKRVVLLLDEAQWFRNPRQLLMTLAHIYDYHYDKITPIITGSAVGVMRSILQPDRKSPLYGRPMIQMEVKTWVPSISMGFLTEGLKQNRVSLDEQTRAETVNVLDGIPGWLTMFGYYFTAQPKEYDKSLERTINEALKIVDDETRHIAKLARGWPGHTKILQNLISGSKKFTELKEATDQTNASLARHLDVLQRLSYIEKNGEGRYTIVDPMLRELLRKRKGRV